MLIDRELNGLADDYRVKSGSKSELTTQHKSYHKPQETSHFQATGQKALISFNN
jgi:hypothetical protein